MENEPGNETIIGKESTFRTNSSEYNAGTRHKQLIHEEHNSAYNHHAIVSRINTGMAYDLVHSQKESGACFVIGSGPSLDDAIPYLKNWHGGIICTTSHALTLMYHGIEPSHIMVLDPFSMWDEISGVDWSATRTKLITHPGAWPDLIENWPNEMLLYRQNMGKAEPFYSGTQHRMYTRREGTRDATFHFLITTQLTVFACSPPAQMFAAQILGYSRVYLSGVDFAFHSGKERFTGYTVKRPAYAIQSAASAQPIAISAEWEKHEHPFVREEGREYIETSNGLLTEKVHIYYKKNMISAWRLSLMDVYTTDHGAITEIPYVPINEALEGLPGKRKQFPQKKIKEVADDYMAQVGVYAIESSGGLTFIEVEKPLEQLPSYMESMKRHYVCDGCGATGVSNDDIDHSGENCSVCKTGKMARAVDVDVKKNMQRIRKLVEKYAEKS